MFIKEIGFGLKNHKLKTINQKQPKIDWLIIVDALLWHSFLS